MSKTTHVWLFHCTKSSFRMEKIRENIQKGDIFGDFLKFPYSENTTLPYLFCVTKTKKWASFLDENKENTAFSRNGNIRKFRKTQSLLTMKISVCIVFSYTENVITRRNYHLFKSFLIKENKKWHKNL